MAKRSCPTATQADKSGTSRLLYPWRGILSNNPEASANWPRMIASMARVRPATDAVDLISIRRRASITASFMRPWLCKARKAEFRISGLSGSSISAWMKYFDAAAPS